MSVSKKEILRPDEVAVRLDVCINTVYKLIREGKIKAIRIERHLRVRVSDFNAFIAKHSTGGERR